MIKISFWNDDILKNYSCNFSLDEKQKFLVLMPEEREM